MTKIPINRIFTLEEISDILGERAIRELKLDGNFQNQLMLESVHDKLGAMIGLRMVGVTEHSGISAHHEGG